MQILTVSTIKIMIARVAAVIPKTTMKSKTVVGELKIGLGRSRISS